MFVAAGKKTTEFEDMLSQAYMHILYKCEYYHKQHFKGDLFSNINVKQMVLLMILAQVVLFHT